MLYQNRLLFKLRGLLSSMGVFRLLYKFVPKTDYEYRVDLALKKHIRSGDVVWDVGANVGVYTEKFLSWVGPQGRVVAFEPGLEALASLREIAGRNSNMVLFEGALGARDAVMSLSVEERSVNNRVLDSQEASPNSVDVTVRSGDSLVAEAQIPKPNVIKIDTEGFEGEVVLGLQCMLRDGHVRVICVEVHFSVLYSRKQAEVPAGICKIFQEAGGKVAWIDKSHVLAIFPE